MVKIQISFIYLPLIVASYSKYFPIVYTTISSFMYYSTDTWPLAAIFHPEVKLLLLLLRLRGWEREEKEGEQIQLRIHSAAAAAAATADFGAALNTYRRPHTWPHQSSEGVQYFHLYRSPPMKVLRAIRHSVRVAPRLLHVPHTSALWAGEAAAVETVSPKEREGKTEEREREAASHAFICSLS